MNWDWFFGMIIGMSIIFPIALAIGIRITEDRIKDSK